MWQTCQQHAEECSFTVRLSNCLGGRFTVLIFQVVSCSHYWCCSIRTSTPLPFTPTVINMFDTSSRFSSGAAMQQCESKWGQKEKVLRTAIIPCLVVSGTLFSGCLVTVHTDAVTHCGRTAVPVTMIASAITSPWLCFFFFFFLSVHFLLNVILPVLAKPPENHLCCIVRI